jgi:hypothetical protein
MEMVMDIMVWSSIVEMKKLLCGADDRTHARVVRGGRAFPPKITASWKELPAK